MSALLLVALGGAAGSAGRSAIALALPGSPLAATLLVNVVGAFALGVLIAVLTGTAPEGWDGGEQARRRRRDRQLRARLLLGTGLCGGFTTYSALALQAAELVQDSAMLTAAGYALVTLVAGTSASVSGLALGGAVGARRSAERGRS